MITQRQFVKRMIAEEMMGTYTNLPGKVLEYDASTQTAIVQPLINYTWDDGVVQEDAPIGDVPVIFPSAGGGIISFPIEVGDTVLLCFSMRSIDSWVEGDGSSSTPSENRFHELSDAIAIPGLYPKQNSLQPSSEDVEIKFKGNRVTLKANGDITIEGGRIDLGEGADESIVLGDAFKAYFDSHTHNYTPYPNGVAGLPVPTSNPNTPMPPSTLSDKVKAE